MILFPNAKINIGLHVLSKRLDGYHNIETVMVETGFTDILEFVENRKGTKLEITGKNVPGDPEKNLVVKAWKLISEEYFIPPVTIHLHKMIPAGAGLGGGSSDGAYMLKGLNEYFDLQIPLTELMMLAAKLGSDCAFFIENKTSFIGGRGDIITPAPEIIKNMWLGLYYPGSEVSTAEAYSMVTPNASRESLINIVLKDIKKWKDYLVNDFEEPVFKKYPVIADIKRKLYNSGAVFASMSGSGSTVFGIFEEEPSVDEFLVWKEKLGKIDDRL